MGISYLVNKIIATQYFKRPELAKFLDFQYPRLGLQFSAMVNELCHQGNLTISPFVRSAAFELTNNCNLHCVICPNKSTETRKKGFMDFGMFKKIIDENPQLEMVQLNGWGESFLHREIFDFIHYAKAKGRRVYLYSNATLFSDEKIYKIISSKLNRLIISVDGLKETYEKIRGFPYERLENSIRKLVQQRDETKSSLIIEVSMVGSKITEGDVARYKEYWRQRVDRVQVLSYIEHTKKLRTAKCRELWRGHPQIHWDGSVSVCCADWAGELYFAKIGKPNYNLQKIWNCDAIKKMRKSHIRKEFSSLCSRCNEYSSEIIPNRFGK